MEPVSAAIAVQCIRCGAIPRQVFICFRRDYGAQQPVPICGECVARAAAELGSLVPEFVALVNRFGLTFPGERR